eukprot:15583893-Heterocapsa_arctica.AAC.1
MAFQSPSSMAKNDVQAFVSYIYLILLAKNGIEACGPRFQNTGMNIPWGSYQAGVERKLRPLLM